MQGAQDFIAIVQAREHALASALFSASSDAANLGGLAAALERLP
jgi:hypothetical protein